MSSGIEYAIWIMPNASVKNKSSEIISLLSKKYKSPKFKPHITVMAVKNIEEGEMIKKVSELINSKNQFEIRLSKLGYNDRFFQCIFVKAEAQELIALNKKAQKLFSIKEGYMPHLSLMYGNFPSEIKEKIIKDIGKNFGMRFVAEELHVIKGVSPDPKDWHVIKKFNLLS